jgi:hypothetical protein
MLRLGLVERQLIVAIHDWHYYDLNEQALRKKCSLPDARGLTIYKEAHFATLKRKLKTASSYSAEHPRPLSSQISWFSWQPQIYGKSCRCKWATPL